MRIALRTTIMAGVTATAVLVPAAMASAASSGAGAEMPAAAYTSWCTTSALCTYAVRDPSAGIPDLARGTADWVGVDEPLSSGQRRAAGGPVAYYPTMLQGIAVATNVPGVDGHHINLRGTTIGEIFAGRITNWNDSRIRATNRRHPMPRSLPITLCVPARPSGTSFDFSLYLGKVSAAFRTAVGPASMRPAWKGTRIVRTPHVTDVGECVQRNAGAITFLPFSDAMTEGLSRSTVAVGKREKVSYGRGKNRTVVTHNVFMHPTQEDIAAAGKAVGSRIGADLTADVTNSGAKGAYPITAMAYVVVRSDRPMRRSTKRTLQYFLSPAAQGRLAGMGYAPLPPALLARARAQLASAR